MASLSRSNGYQISDDMSQVIASRYAEMAASPEFRDLGAPSLTNTTPSPHQREVRNMIVGRSLSNMRPMAWRRFRQACGSGCDDGECARPAEFSMPSAAPRPQGRGGAGSAPRHSLKDQAMHRERAVMRRAMMRLGRQFSGGD
jgi:conjugal transfer mating pair stabilization protein TraG